MRHTLFFGLLVTAGCLVDADRSLLNRDAHSDGSFDVATIDLDREDGDAKGTFDVSVQEGPVSDGPVPDEGEILDDSAPDTLKPDSKPPTPHAAIKSVRSGSGVIADAKTSVDISVSPVLADTQKTLLFYQASSNRPDPKDGAVRCLLASTSKITCDRSGTIGTVDIQWYAAEFKSGVSVQHLQPPCAAGGTTQVTIAKVDPAKTFLLYSTQRDGTNFGNDDFQTVRLTGATSVEIVANATSCDQDKRALQVVQMDGVKVTRGLTQAMSGTALTVSGQPKVTPSRAFLLYTWQASGATAAICDRVVRGTLDASTSITFSRGAGASGCAGDPLPAIAWERVELWSGAAVEPLSVVMAAGVGAKDVALAAAVDPSRTVIFAGGQGEQGQAIGEGSYAANDIIGAMAGRHLLVSASKARVLRDATGGKARWTSFVVEF